MKKREVNNNLKLGKRVISNLQEHSIQGGTDSITTGTYIIVTTIKILTEHITNPRICKSVETDCTMTTVTTSTPVPATTSTPVPTTTE
ncbi:hypothetical protein [uncultured Kordia sp.]|uniref:hypothetical protein n=1 Tax=uncultured Kordia sp. TaxID=507699 RepID=UPI00260576BB|nr:hypothetical protein [uncultured Kordia sp.]